MSGAGSRGIRAGERCWYAELREDWQSAWFTGPRYQWKRGVLLFWSTDHASYGDGVGQFPVGVIEPDTGGRLAVVHVCRISFDDPRPEDFD